MSRSFFVEQRTASLSVNVAESLDFIPHLHSQIELVLARRGEGTVTIEGVSHVMRPGEAALCWPNRVHSYGALPGGSLYYMAICDTALLGRTGEAFARTDCAMPFLVARDVHPDVELALGRLIGEPDMPAALRRAFAIIAVERLLAALDVVPREHTADPDALHRTLAYIEANLSGEISLDGMARAQSTAARGLDVRLEKREAMERILNRESALLRRYEQEARAEMDRMRPEHYAFCALYFLAGLSLTETAEAIDRSERQCMRYKREIEQEEG